LILFGCVSKCALNTDCKKASGGSSKKKKSSKSSRKKSAKANTASDHDEDNADDATDGYDTCSAEKCLQPTGEWLPHSITHKVLPVLYDFKT